MNAAALLIMAPLLLVGQPRAENPDSVSSGPAQSAPPTAGGDIDPAVAAGREALDHWWPQGYPWYDPENDAVRRIEIPETRDWSWLNDTAGNTWDWFKGVFPEAFRTWISDTWSGFWSWIGDCWDWLWSWPETPVAWGLRFLLVLSLGVFLYFAVRRIAAVWMDGKADGEAATGSGEDTGDESRIEALPFPIRRGTLDLLAEARAFYEQGDYRQAIIFLFSFQLVRLDRQQIIRLAKGKTNRQYLREIAPRWPLARLLGQTMVVFEDVFFGNRSLERARFESCWTRLDEFESLATEKAR